MSEQSAVQNDVAAELAEIKARLAELKEAIDDLRSNHGTLLVTDLEMCRRLGVRRKSRVRPSMF